MSSNKTSASGVLSATVIHEITQPLTALTLNISNALRSLTSEEYVLLRSQIFQCKDSAERISEIIQMIRSIFASETLQAGESDLGEVANSVYNYAITDCRESGIEFNLELQTGVTTTANFREVQHIVLNLIINSIQNLQLQDRYKKTLTIRVWREATQAKLSVADNGGGIPEEFRTSLFSLLDTTKKDGMGVGLWLCKQIAERNKGSITYYPNGHQGSIFEICFPLVSEIEYTSKIKIQ